MGICEFIEDNVIEYLHNEELGQAVIKMLKKTIYTSDLMTVRESIESTLNNKPTVPIVSEEQKPDWHKSTIDTKLNVIPSSRGYAGSYQHDWWDGGNLNHSILAYKEAVNIWKAWVSRYPFLDNPLVEDTIRIGSLLHDIGKVAVFNSEYAEKKDIAGSHEYFSTAIIETFLDIDDMRLKEMISHCGIGHHTYYQDKNTMNIAKKPYKCLEHDYITTLIIAFADKIASGRSRVSCITENSLDLEKQKAKLSVQEHCKLIYEDTEIYLKDNQIICCGFVFDYA